MIWKNFWLKKVSQKLRKKLYHFCQRSQESVQEFLIKDNGQSEPKRFRHCRVKFLTFFCLDFIGVVDNNGEIEFGLWEQEHKTNQSVAGFLSENVVKILKRVVIEGGND